jgi:hypothetical protein
VQLHANGLQNLTTERQGLVSSNCALYLGDTGYESRLKDRLPSLETFVVFLSPSKDSNRETNLTRPRLKKKRKKKAEKKQNFPGSRTGIEQKTVTEGVK